jgi:hypothetical protein
MVFGKEMREGGWERHFPSCTPAAILRKEVGKSIRFLQPTIGRRGGRLNGLPTIGQDDMLPISPVT